jgi:protein TonB
MSLLTTATVPSSLSLPDPPVATRTFTYPLVAMPVDQPAGSSPHFAQIVTTVLWFGCILVGTLGFVLPYARPHPAAVAPAPVTVEKLKVELTTEQPTSVIPLSNQLTAPPPPAALVQPQIAQPIAVAEPSAIVFALPVDGPTITVTPDEATHSRPSAIVAPVSNSLPSPQALVFGQGEGRQPAPEYPAHSVKLGQEGVVDIRLTVDPSGQVIDTSVASPCPWPLLNDAAERTVRHRWRFSRGSLRVYEVAIRFALAR